MPVTNKNGSKALKHSNFMITINPNKRVDRLNLDDYEEFKKSFEKCLRAVFEEEGFKRIFKFYNSKDRTLEFANLDDPIHDLKPIEIIGEIEIGEKEQRLHAHNVILTSHRSSFQIDKHEIIKIFEENGLTGVYVHIDIDKHANFDSNNWIKNQLAYIRKNPV